MRILVSFFIGFLSSFFVSELIITLLNKISLQKIARLNHSYLGLVLIAVGFGAVFFTRSDPTKTLTAVFLSGTGLGLLAHQLLTRRYILSEDLEKKFFHEHESAIERALEILPGALMWLAITSPLWLSYTLPFAVAYIIILADIYWLITAVRIAVLIYLGYKKMEYAKKQNWLQLLKKDFPIEWEKYSQLLVLPTYKEGIEILQPAFDAIMKSTYPPEKIFLAVGFEERDDPEKIAECQKYLNEVVAKKIGGVFTTIHPYGLSGEVPGPGSNRNFIINNAVKEFTRMGIFQKQVFVTTLDADFVIHHQFLAGALHKYLTIPEDTRDKRSFTGVFMYHNNYWQAPTPMRIIAAGTAFWQLSEMVGSDKYINFSSLSINLHSLLDIGLWMPNKVNDDSGFFWKAYYHFKGDYKVIPHYLPISADTVMDVNMVKTFQNQYFQLKRWAYGVEHIPFIVTKYFTTQNLNFWDKTDKLTFIMWSYFKWGTLALFITFAGLLVPLVNHNYSQSVVAYNLPVISSWILTGAFIGLFATIYVHEKTVPKRPANWSPLIKFWSFIQWALIPIVLVTIASIPAIDAQTSLMLGKYLEFRTTIKARKL